MEKYLEPPWGWFGSQNGLYLTTQHSGCVFAMGFQRMGMHGAQPTFQVDGRMVPASDLVRFEVGDGKAKGFAQGKANPSVYRYDIVSIDHPVAHQVAAAPQLLAALKCLLRDHSGIANMAPKDKDAADLAIEEAAKDAIAAAEPER